MKQRIDLAGCSQCHCLAARRAARQLTRHYDRHLRPHGMRATQFSILVTLATAGARSIGVLAALLGLERTTLTRSAALLERAGWVETMVSNDARERRLRLTKSGTEALTSAYPAWKKAQESTPASARAAGQAPIDET